MNVRRMLAGSAVLAAVTVGAIGAAAPAFASEGDGVRQAGEFIEYRDCAFTGPFFDFASPTKNAYVDSSEFYVNDVTPVDNNTSSVENRSAVNSVNAFLNANLTGPRLVVLPNQRIDLCAAASAFDNGLSSHSF